mgnify:CR=1 FL=1
MKTFTKLIIPHNSFIHLVDYDDILYCQSDNCYTYVHLISGERFILIKSLSKVEKLLNVEGFIRINQSFLVNRHYIKTINKKEKNISLSNEAVLPFTVPLKKLIGLINQYEVTHPTFQ